MLKSRSFLVFSIVFCCSLSAQAQDAADWDGVGNKLAGATNATAAGAGARGLFSASAAERFYEVAYELAYSPDIGGAEAEQAIIFLTATMNLDSGANYVHPVLLELACQYSERDYSQLVYRLLANYVDDKADLEPAQVAIRYLLEQLDSREQREKLLGEMLKNLGGKSAVLDSELATELGLLKAETTDLESAQSYLIQAYNNNKYNKPAFAKLAELAGERLTPAMYLEHIRLTLGENPVDIDAALAFAQYAEQLQLYETAADAYEYCADLFRFLYPSQRLQVLVIKTAMGNRALAWDFRPPSSGKLPDIPEDLKKWEGLEYRLMVEGVRKTLDNIATILPNYKGQGYEIAGFGWFQGHKDGGKQEWTDKYESNLVNLIKDVRAEFKVPKLPVVVATVAFGGREMKGRYMQILEAQMAVSGEKGKYPEFAGNVFSVDTRDFWRSVEESPSNQGYHYNRNAETYVLVGDALGRGMRQLLGDITTGGRRIR